MPTALAPWDELADAYAAIEDAGRCGDVWEAAIATVRFNECRDRLGLVAATIFAAAVSAFGAIDGETPLAGYVPRDVWEKIAGRLGIRDVALKAIDDARQAKRMAKSALERIDGLMALVKSLEKRIDDLTTGVCEPTK